MVFDRKLYALNEARQGIPANDSSLLLALPLHRNSQLCLDDLSKNEARRPNHAPTSTFCTPHAASGLIAPVHPATRQHWTTVSCTSVYAHVDARSRVLCRPGPTKLIHGSLACAVPLSVAASATAASTHTPNDSQDISPRRLRAGHEQHKVETAA